MKTLVALLFTVCLPLSRADEPIFVPNDIVALTGGEDMAVRRDFPALELLILQQPGLSGVKFRNLAFEGDTVFEQFRDLNFPPWEEQLKKVGATVVIAQFGKMESLQGDAGLPGFIAAYEKLLGRFAQGGRRALILAPALPRVDLLPPSGEAYLKAQRALAERRGWTFVDTSSAQHADALADALSLQPVDCSRAHPLWPLLKEKNMLWFHYWRPQNWAFLHGDRTEQPSSRDHLDPTKRWFPEEMEQWLPLVAAKERQIQEMVETPRQP